MKLTSMKPAISAIALALAFGAAGTAADALTLKYDLSSSSTNGASALDTEGTATFSFFDDTSVGNSNLRIDVTVKNLTSTASFMTGYGFDVLGTIEGVSVGGFLDEYFSGDFPSITVVTCFAASGPNCQAGDPNGGVPSTGSTTTDTFSVFTKTSLDSTTAEAAYRSLFLPDTPFTNATATSVMRWQDVQPSGGSETKFNPNDPHTIPPIPLPAAGWMLITGLGGLAAMRRRKKG